MNNKENKYGAREVLELMVYDEDGNFITRLDTLRNSKITINKLGSAALIATDALLNIDLIQFIHGDTFKSLTDFNKMIKCIASKTISFNVNKMTKPCKLIAKTVIRSVNDLKDIYAFYEIPYANIVSNFRHECIDNLPNQRAIILIIIIKIIGMHLMSRN